jgi:hypothetical protein
MVNLLWPEYKSTPLLKKKSLILTAAAVIITTSIMMVIIWNLQTEYPIPYIPNPILLLGSVSVISLLIGLAYYYRKRIISIRNIPLLHPFIFALSGFFLQFSILFIPSILAENLVDAPITILFQISSIILIILFVKFQVLHQKITINHLTSFIFGSIFFWIILTPIQEFINYSTGMFITGVISFILLVYWRYLVHKKTASISFINQ